MNNLFKFFPLILLVLFFSGCSGKENNIGVNNENIKIKNKQEVVIDKISTGSNVEKKSDGVYSLEVQELMSKLIKEGPDYLVNFDCKTLKTLEGKNYCKKEKKYDYVIEALDSYTGTLNINLEKGN